MRFCFAFLALIASLAHAQIDVFKSEQFTIHDDEWWSSSKQLKPASTHVCTLSQLYGRAPVGRVYVGPNGYWQLRRLTGSGSGVVVSARCYELAAFNFSSGGASTQRWVSENFSVSTDGSCNAAVQTTWWSDAGTILQGIQADRGLVPNRFALVAQENRSPFVPSRLLAMGCHIPVYWSPPVFEDTRVTAYANALFVGIPHSGQMAKFVGPFGVGTALQSGVYFVEAETSSSDRVGRLSTTIMAPVNDAMCYFTGIGGTFGLSNQVRIFPSNGNWVLQAWTGALSHAGSVRAWAMCMLRNQF